MSNPQSIVRGAFFIVTAEFSFALSAALIKLVSASLPNESIVFFRNLFGLAILIPLLFKAGNQILTTTIGQLLLTRGYQNAPASSVGIFTYTSIVFGTFLGWLFWQELLDTNFYLGAILIVFAGLIIVNSKSPPLSRER